MNMRQFLGPLVTKWKFNSYQCPEGHLFSVEDTEVYFNNNEEKQREACPECGSERLQPIV
jgi:hypothetical protein